MAGPIIRFSFGYWGWGNATGQLVRAGDTVEGFLGHEPPLNIDIGIKRAGHAQGSSGSRVTSY